VNPFDIFCSFLSQFTKQDSAFTGGRSLATLQDVPLLIYFNKVNQLSSHATLCCYYARVYLICDLSPGGNPFKEN